MKTILVNVYGRVQGVGFRYFTLKTAHSFHIRGSVKNELDGSVTVKAMGQDQDIDQFLKALEVGNGFSHVDCMSIESLGDKSFSDFEVEY